MTSCKQLTKELLTNPVDLLIDEKNLDFSGARSVADEKASELASSPMLLGWYDKTTGRFSPKVECCSEKKPGWLVYAESRGGNITININNETFVFVYADVALMTGEVRPIMRSAGTSDTSRIGLKRAGTVTRPTT